MTQIILGSTSPRRKDILELTGLKFKVVPPDYEEDMTLPMPPKKLVAFLSRGKAESVSSRFPKAVVISADTFVVLGKEVLGKSHNKKRAEEVLKKLNGKTHLVLTGLTISQQSTKKVVTMVSSTKVSFVRMTEKEIKKLASLPETWDKAGGYALQEMGGIFINKVDGDMSNVIGLPLTDLRKGLKKFNINI